MNEINTWARLNAGVPKLLNLIAKIVPYIMENYLILDISLDVCILLVGADSRLFTAYLSCSLSSCRMHLCVMSVSEVHALL